MRSLNSLSLLIVRDSGRCCAPLLLQTMTQRDALVEHETVAAPSAVGFRDLLQISQDAALEVVDLGKTLREQMRACLLAPNAAGAEHRDPLVPDRIELARGEALELAEILYLGIACALERPQRDLERIARVEHQHVRRGDQRVPIGGIDVDADLPGWIGRGIAERDDLLLQPDFQPPEGHLACARIIQLDTAEPATEQGAVAEFLDQPINPDRWPGQGAIDTFSGQQHAALQAQRGAEIMKRRPDCLEIRQRGELIEGSNLESHAVVYQQTSAWKSWYASHCRAGKECAM